MLRISPYSVRIWENKDQNNSEYGHFLRSELQQFLFEKRCVLNVKALGVISFYFL